MTTIAGIIAAFAASHLGGAVIGEILGKFGLIGFGRKLEIARGVLKIGKAIRKNYIKDPSVANREELKRWIDANDPRNEAKIGDGVT